MENFFENYEPLYPRHPIYKIHPYKFHGSYIEVPTVNKEKEVTGYSFVDINDSDDVLQYSYRKYKSDRTWYAISNTGIAMHNIIMYDELDGLEADHEDRCGFNNRRKNLRPATRRQQNQNKSKKINASCKFYGVRKISHGGYVTSMKINQNQIYLGYFQNEQDAAKMYDANVILEHGIKCHHNKLLSQEDIDYIVTNKKLPEKYQVKQIPRKYPYLPDNIAKTSNDKFRFKKWRNGIPECWYFETLEEATMKKTEMINIWEKEDSLKEQKRCTNPLMKNNKYVIPVRRYNKIYAFYVDHDIWLKISHVAWTMDELGYTIGQYESKLWSMHRLIWILINGPIDDDLYTIDHINPNKKYDHRIHKLRLADKRLQSHNMSKSHNKIDPYLGVQPKLQGFTVEIDNTHYGPYETQEEAALKANEIYAIAYPDIEVPNNIDLSKKTTLDSRLDGRMNRKYISSITSILHLQHVLVKLGLTEILGTKLRDLRSSDRKKIQQYVLDEYYPMNSYKEEDDHSMDDYVDKSIFPGWPIITQEELDKHYEIVIPKLEIDFINRITNVDVLKQAIMSQRLNKKFLKDGTGIDIASITSALMLEYKKKLIKILYPDCEEIIPTIHESTVTDTEILITWKYIDDLIVDEVEKLVKECGLNSKNGGGVTVRDIKKHTNPYYKYLIKKHLYPHVIFNVVENPDDIEKPITEEYIDSLSIKGLTELIGKYGLNGKNNNKNALFLTGNMNSKTKPTFAHNLIMHLNPNSTHKIKVKEPPPPPTAQEIEKIGKGPLKAFKMYITSHKISKNKARPWGINPDDITHDERDKYIALVKQLLNVP